MLRIVEVKGKDAAQFLHRVTAGTVRGVGVNEGRPGLLLTGQSRVLAQFDLLRLDECRYLLAAPEECAAALATELEKLHFAEALELTLTDTRASAIPAEDARRGEGASFALRAGAVQLEWPSPVPGFDFSTSAVDEPAGWEWSRIGALVPWPGSEWASGETPALEAGMLPWIDRHKGCYPGQEVVERSLNVGHPARVLVAVEGEEAAGARFASDAASGAGAVVTSVARGNGSWRALVRLPWGRRENFPPGISRLKAHW